MNRIDQSQAIQLWTRLGAHGTAPTEVTSAARVLPSYTAGIGPWIDRLSNLYLRGNGPRPGLCQSAAHFKLVLAPYGGGKTHFLLALGARGLEDGFAVSYVPCGGGVSLESPLDVHRVLVKHLQLPGRDQPGLRPLLDEVIRLKREDIERRDVPDIDIAFRRWLLTVRRSDYPENSFGRVIAAALEAVDRGEDSDVSDAALYWLQGEPGLLSKGDMHELHLAKIPAANRKQFGMNLMLSTVKFLPNAGVRGLVLLLDEAETLFAVRSQKALLRILAAIRVMLDVPDSVPGGIPLFGVFSAVPDVLDDFDRYPALKQRLAVFGAPFEAGNDFSVQLPLDKVQGQETLLQEIGEKLIEVGAIATGHSFDIELQMGNVRRLVRVASDRNLDVDARRMFVKTWVSLLQIQAADGESEFHAEELTRRYQGDFEQLQGAHGEGFEP